jgi:uncharacterized protein YegL
MDFAKYQEDIVSRHNSDRAMDTKNQKVAVQKKVQPAKRLDAEPTAVDQLGSKLSLEDFTISRARPLPVIVLADTSGSMSTDGKIETLNRSMREMINCFANEDDLRAEVQVGVIAFGGAKAQVKQVLTRSRDVKWQDLKAAGRTPLGSAFALATQWLEDREVVPTRSYVPTIVLVSDGQPDQGDQWKEELEKLLASGRGGKAHRLALAIGTDADEAVLAAFVGNLEIPVLRAKDVNQVAQFFRFVTMSVTSRLASTNPNQPPLIATFDLDKFEDF